jgi:hypothetical protein
MQKLLDQMQTKADTQFKKFNCNYILSDLKIDFDSLSQTQGTKFIWIVRDMGTQLMDIAELALVDSYANIEAKHYLKNWHDNFKVYILDITKKIITPAKKSDIEKAIANAITQSKNVLVKYKAYGEIYHKTVNVITSYSQYALDQAKWFMDRKFGISEEMILEMVETV